MSGWMIWCRIKSSDGMEHLWIVKPGMAEIGLERTMSYWGSW